MLKDSKQQTTPRYITVDVFRCIVEMNFTNQKEKDLIIIEKYTTRAHTAHRQSNARQAYSHRTFEHRQGISKCCFDSHIMHSDHYYMSLGRRYGQPLLLG